MSSVYLYSNRWLTINQIFKELLYNLDIIVIHTINYSTQSHSQPNYLFMQNLTEVILVIAKNIK